jgi:hypothetical protein
MAAETDARAPPGMRLPHHSNALPLNCPQVAMTGTYRAHTPGIALWPGRVGRRLGVLLASILCGILCAGGNCIAVKAMGEAGSPIATHAAPSGSGERSVMPAGDRSHAVTSSDSGVINSGQLVAGSPFLAADALLAGLPRQAAPPAISRSFDRAFSDRRQHGAIRTLEPDALALHAVPLDEQRVRVHLPANDFAETGPGTVTASMSGLDVDALRSVAGGRLQWITAGGERSRVLAEARLSWLFEYLQSDAGATAFFAPGDKGIFAVQGLSYGSNWALVGCGVRWELSAGLSVYAHYDLQYNPLQLFHIGSSGLAYAW